MLSSHKKFQIDISPLLFVFGNNYYQICFVFVNGKKLKCQVLYNNDRITTEIVKAADEVTAIFTKNVQTNKGIHRTEILFINV